MNKNKKIIIYPITLKLQNARPIIEFASALKDVEHDEARLFMDKLVLKMTWKFINQFDAYFEFVKTNLESLGFEVILKYELHERVFETDEKISFRQFWSWVNENETRDPI